MGQSINSPLTNGHKYNLDCVDYFIKWIESIALKDVTQNDVIDFVENHWRRHLIMPQANAQVEAMYKIIIGLIKKYINYGPRNWHNTLDLIGLNKKYITYFSILHLFSQIWSLLHFIKNLQFREQGHS